MKAALNGLPNLSILDGWWAEGCRHGVNGWAIGGESPGDDARDGAVLHDLLEREVLTAWADRARWIGMMQSSIAVAEERFTSERMVREYAERLHGPTQVPAPPAPRAAGPGPRPLVG
jgi:starch phosphorylase